MNRIKDLIVNNLYEKKSTLVENFSLEKDEIVLAEEFDKLYEAVEKLTEGPLANIFGAIQQGYKAYSNSRLVQKVDGQIAKNLKKDSKNINAAIGVLASSLSKRINRLGDLGKQLNDKLKDRNPEIADQVDHAINARILDASEFLNRVTAAKNRLAADVNTDPQKSIELSQKADELENKADERNEQQQAKQVKIGPEKEPEEEKTVDDIMEPDKDIEQIVTKIQNATPEVKDGIKDQIRNTLKNKGTDLLAPILKKANITESQEMEEREYRGIINPTTIAQLLKDDGSKLKSFKSLSRAKQNLIARELEKAVLSDISNTPEMKQVVDDPEETPSDSGEEIPSDPEETPQDTPKLDRSDVVDKKLKSVKDMIYKAGHGAKAQGYAVGVINFVVNDFNKTGSAKQTIQNLSNNPKWGEILGSDAKSIAIQIFDGLSDITTENNDRPIVNEMRMRLRRTIL